LEGLLETLLTFDGGIVVVVVVVVVVLVLVGAGAGAGAAGFTLDAREGL
jgi:hypothetical protein